MLYIVLCTKIKIIKLGLSTVSKKVFLMLKHCTVKVHGEMKVKLHTFLASTQDGRR
jgi:hypothetical protein